MKKFYLSLFVMFAVLIGIITMADFNVLASTEDITYITYDSSSNPNGLRFEELSNVENAIDVNANECVTIKDVSVILTNCTLTNIINIKDGGELILDNVKFVLTNSSVSNVIENYGLVTLNNVIFPSTKLNVVSVSNQSNKTNAVMLHNIEVATNNQMKVKLLNGSSLWVDEDTNITGIVDIVLDMDYASYTNDDIIGRPIVRGNNTFAGTHLSHFSWQDAPSEDNIDNSANYLFKDFKNNYYLDYAGMLGDDISDITDTYNIENDSTTYTLKSGDIIITKFSIKLKDKNVADTNIADDGGYVYVGGKYATARMLIDNAHCMYYVKGIIVENKSITETSQSFCLDNVTALFGSSAGNLVKYANNEDSDDAKANKITLDETFTQILTINAIADDTSLTSKQVYLPNAFTDTTNNLDYTSKIMVQINNNGMEYEFSDWNENCNFQIVYYFENANMLIMIIEAGNNFEVDTLCLSLRSVAEILDVTLSLNTLEINYDGTDHARDFLPTYEIDETTYTFNLDEVELYSGDTLCTSIINAGSYKVVAKPRDNINYINNGIEFKITPRVLSLTIINSYTYDGSEKQTVITPNNLVAGDGLGLVVSNNEGHVNVGSYSQNISITNNNYVLIAEQKYCTLKINKAIILDSDMSLIQFNSVSGAYDPNKDYVVAPTNVPDGVTFSYTTGTGSNIRRNAGSYVVTIRFMLKDPNNFEFESDKYLNKVANIVIEKRLVDTSNLQFNDINVDYTGKNVVATVTGDLPVQISKIVYTGNVQVNASDTPYIATARFILGDAYRNNYKLDREELTCKITINKLDFDLNRITCKGEVFDGLLKTYVYDGVAHELIIDDYYSDIINLEFRGVSAIGVGEYEYVAIVTVTNSNYNDIGSVTLSAKIIITPATLDVSEIKFVDKTTEFTGDKIKLECVNVPSMITVNYEYYLGSELVSTDGVINRGNYLVVASFNVNEGKDNYKDIDKMSAKLTVAYKELDLTNTKLNDRTVEYNGKAHDIKVISDLSEISFEYITYKMQDDGSYTIWTESIIDAGVYKIDATLVYDSENIKLNNYTPLSAKLTVLKATYDMSKVKFNSATFTYDKTLKQVLISGTLPDGVRVLRYTNNEAINAGEYIAKVEFTHDNANYYNIPDKTCILTVLPKRIDIKLKANEFIYSGQKVVLEPVAEGLIVGDEVDIETDTHNGINVGNYRVPILSLNNTNYKSQDYVSFSIKKADVDLSEIIFKDINCEYDGKEHIPTFLGDLPSGITVNIIKPKAINVGTYITYAEFKNVNTNYNTPSRISAKTVITPKKILAEFIKEDNFVEDGTIKNIDVNFIGICESDFKSYEIVYSSTPIKAGKYTANLILKSDNYILLSDDTYAFEILTRVKSYADSNVSLTLTSSGFKNDAKVELKDIKTEAQNVLGEKSIKSNNLEAFKLKLSESEYRQEVTVNIKINFLKSNAKNLKVFKIIDGELTELDYEIIAGSLQFLANVDDDIVIVELASSSSVALTYVIVASVLLVLICVTIVCLKKRGKKQKNSEYFIDIDE